MSARKDITGQTFGRLTALRFDHQDKHGKAMWLFFCQCGNSKVMRAADAQNGRITSCGCGKLVSKGVCPHCKGNF